MIVKIMLNGADWFKAIGTRESAGTKALCISGDCETPGFYEIEYGMTINEMLEMVGATFVQAVQIAGPSGVCIAPDNFNRKISYEDLPTGGAMIVIGRDRDLLREVVLNYIDFFIEVDSGHVGDVVWSTLSLDGFEGSGADWLEQYKPYINDGETVVTNPHKVYGPESNDLALQLRKRGVSKVVLAGMSANLCVEAHMRELLENGFEVSVVKDATAAAVHPELGNGYDAALVNFGFMANAVLTTEEAVGLLS